MTHSIIFRLTSHTTTHEPTMSLRVMILILQQNTCCISLLLREDHSLCCRIDEMTARQQYILKLIATSTQILFATHVDAQNNNCKLVDRCGLVDGYITGTHVTIPPIPSVIAISQCHCRVPLLKNSYKIYKQFLTLNITTQ